MLHVVFKSRKDELEQMKDGLESLSLINFLRLSEGCMRYVFPLQIEATVTKDEFLRAIDYRWVETLDGTQKKALHCFVQYVNEVDLGKEGKNSSK